MAIDFQTHSRSLAVIRSGALLAFLALTGGWGRAQSIPNPSFETNPFTVWPGYCSANGSIMGWRAGDTNFTGLNPAGTIVPNPFANNGATPDGNNVAFIQTAASTNSLSTTISNLTPGAVYRVTCRINARAGFATPTMGLAFDGGPATSFTVPPVATNNVTASYGLAFGTFTATNSTAALTVSSTTSSDGALLLDDFRIAPRPADYFAVAAWTNDLSTGVDATNTLSAYCFGSAINTTINGVTFKGASGVNPAVPGVFAVNNESAVYNNTVNNLTAQSGTGSAALAANFIFGGNPATLTLSNLTAGTGYRLSLFGVAFGNWGNRYALFSGGGDQLTVDEDMYGPGNGIRVDYSFAANATHQVITLTPINSGYTFHLHGFALTRVSAPPAIVGQPTNTAAFAGTAAQLTVSATSTAPLVYQWYWQEHGVLAGATNATLAWSSLAASNAGAYFAVLTNALGSATSSLASVTVLGVGLTSQRARLGTTAFFDAGLTNSTPLLYQWQHNNTNLPNGLITTVAGNGTASFSGDGGPATNAAFNSPRGVAVDGAGNLFIADYYNHRIRKVDVLGLITTVAGNGTYGVPANGAVATNAGFSYPIAVIVDGAGSLSVARYDRVCRVGTNGLITTVAGGSQGYWGDGGPATNAALQTPKGLAQDPAGNLFIADFYNNRVRKVDTNGTITTVAGNDSTSFSGDGGWATNASLSWPAGVAVDGAGRLYVADCQHMRVRVVNPAGVITTVAGNGGNGYSGDGGPAASATFNYPAGVVLDRTGNLFVVDDSNQCIRKVGTDGIISTVAGNGVEGYSGDGGAATQATLRLEGVGLEIKAGVAVDRAGNLFIADTDNQRVRKVACTTSPVLRLDNVTTNDLGSYTLIAFNPLTGLSSTSSVVTLRQPALTSPLIGSPALSGGCVGFTISGESGQTVVVEACENLAAPAWQPVQTNTLGNSPVNFTDPIQSSHRFYRLHSP